MIILHRDMRFGSPVFTDVFLYRIGSRLGSVSIDGHPSLYYLAMIERDRVISGGGVSEGYFG